MTEVATSETKQALPLLNILNRAVDDIWEVKRFCIGPMGQARSYPLFTLVGPAATEQEKGQQFLSRTYDRLLEAVKQNKDELSRQASILYYRPAEWLDRYSWDFTLPDLERYKRHSKGEIIQAVLAGWLRQHPTEAKYALMRERIELLLRGEGLPPKQEQLHPTLVDLLDSALKDPSGPATQICKQVVAGEMGTARPGSVEEPEMCRLFPQLCLRLWQEGSFDYPDFKQALIALPGAYHELSKPLDTPPLPEIYRDLPADFAHVLQAYCQNLANEVAGSLATAGEELVALLKQVAELRGAAWIFLACAYIEAKKLKRLPASNQWRNSKSPSSALVRLCLVRRLPPSEEDRTEVLNVFRQYQPATLLMVLPYAREYQDLICEALEWPGIHDLVQVVEEGKNHAGLEDLPEIATDHFEAVLKTYHSHFPSRKNALDRIKTEYQQIKPA